MVATIVKCNKNHPLFTQKSKDNFKEVTLGRIAV